MENAKVVVFEDVESNRILVKRFLEKFGHEVIGEASTLSEAIALIERMANDKELSADVVLLDGNLKPDTTDCKDARIIFDKLKELNIASKVIGFSGSSLLEQEIEVETDTFKEMPRVIKAIQDFKQSNF